MPDTLTEARVQLIRARMRAEEVLAQAQQNEARARENLRMAVAVEREKEDAR